MMETNLQKLCLSSCVVKAKFPHSKSEGSACGTIINPSKGFVLSHGSILTDHIQANKVLLSKVINGKPIRSNDLPGSLFTLLLSKGLVTLESSKNVDLHYNQNSLIVNGVSSTSSELVNKNPSSNFSQVSCHFVGAFRNNDFYETLDQLMPSSSWTFSDATSDSNSDNNNNDNAGNGDIKNSNQQNVKQEIHAVDNSSSTVSSHLLSYFLLLKFNYTDLKLDVSDDLLSLYQQSSVSNSSSLKLKTRDKCFIGDTAEIIATPFAALCPAVFYNAYSRGVVSNVGGVNNCWLVTDARCIPGCEGGPLYTKRKPTDAASYLTGIIASSLCWKNNEWVGFSVACSFDSVLKSMLRHQNVLLRKSILPTVHKQRESSIKAGSGHKTSASDMAQAVTVLIQSGQTWGTGVVVNRDEGIILTCSHVVKDAGLHKSVTVTPSKSKSRYPGEIVYRQTPVKTAYDLAVIKCQQATRHLPRGWTAQVSTASVGQDVILSGHAVFGTQHNLEPSICKGVISKVIESRNEPVMIQTTCAVHAGASGGPLLTSNGDLVGIAVCNTRDSVSNSSFPHVNLCIPIATVWPVVQRYLSSGDKQCLLQLQVQDVELNQLWALGTHTSQELEDTHMKSKL